MVAFKMHGADCNARCLRDDVIFARKKVHRYCALRINSKDRRGAYIELKVLITAKTQLWNRLSARLTE